VNDQPKVDFNFWFNELSKPAPREGRKFHHSMDINFEVISSDEQGQDVTGAQVREALILRMDTLSDDELLSNCDE